MAVLYCFLNGEVSLVCITFFFIAEACLINQWDTSPNELHVLSEGFLPSYLISLIKFLLDLASLGNCMPDANFTSQLLQPFHKSDNIITVWELRVGAPSLTQSHCQPTGSDVWYHYLSSHPWPFYLLNP